jgi:hypothetical protein
MQLNMLLIIWYMQLNVLHIWDMQPDTRLLIWLMPVLHIYSSNKSIISIADYAVFAYVYELRINELQTRLLILYCTDNAARLYSRSICLWLSELQMKLLIYVPYVTGFSESQMKLLIYVPYVTGWFVWLIADELLIYALVTGWFVIADELLIYALVTGWFVCLTSVTRGKLVRCLNNVPLSVQAHNR